MSDTDTLTGWLAERTGLTGPWEIGAPATGASNDLWFLRSADKRLVVRRPPRDHHDPAMADRILLREARVCRALAATHVPVPSVVAVCDDPSVLGACFLVMEHVDGWTPGEHLPEPYASSRDLRRHLAEVFIDTLADLHLVDWQHVGLDGFGRPDGFLGRQVGRWRSHLEAVRQRDLPGIDDVGAWLEDNRPLMQRAAVMHGDYHFANVMVTPRSPPRIAAVLDWEQSTIGDPLLDLGWVTSAWPDPERPVDVGYVRDRSGMPDRDGLVARYVQRTGLDVSALAYYEVLARYKLACVLEGQHARWLTGSSTDPQHEQMGAYVDTLLADALAAIRSDPPR